MTAPTGETRPLGDPEAPLENAFIDEFLRARGHDVESVRTLPPAEADRLLTEASVYAASKLAEVQSRAHFVHEIHRDE